MSKTRSVPTENEASATSSETSSPFAREFARAFPLRQADAAAPPPAEPSVGFLADQAASALGIERITPLPTAPPVLDLESAIDEAWAAALDEELPPSVTDSTEPSAAQTTQPALHAGDWPPPLASYPTMHLASLTLPTGTAPPPLAGPDVSANNAAGQETRVFQGAQSRVAAFSEPTEAIHLTPPFVQTQAVVPHRARGRADESSRSTPDSWWYSLGMGLLGGSLALVLCVGGWWLLQTTTANSSSSSVTEHAGPLSSGSQATVQRLVQALAARDRRQALAELTQLQQQEPRSEALIQSLKSAVLALPQAP